MKTGVVRFYKEDKGMVLLLLTMEVAILLYILAGCKEQD